MVTKQTLVQFIPSVTSIKDWLRPEEKRVEGVHSLNVTSDFRKGVVETGEGRKKKVSNNEVHLKNVRIEIES